MGYGVPEFAGLLPVLADQPLLRLGGHREHQVAGDDVGAVPYRDRARAAGVGACAKVGGLGVILRSDALMSARQDLTGRKVAPRASSFRGSPRWSGYWATLSLNIPDFTRFARSQRDQAVGPGDRPAHHHAALRLHRHRRDQRHGAALRRGDLESGRPAGAAHRGERQPAARHRWRWWYFWSPPSPPISRPTSWRPANSFSNLSPRRVSFRTGGLLAGLLGVADHALEAARRATRPG